MFGSTKLVMIMQVCSAVIAFSTQFFPAKVANGLMNSINFFLCKMNPNANLMFGCEPVDLALHYNYAIKKIR